MKGYLPTRPSKLKCLLLIVLVTILYFLDNPSVASLMGGEIFNYVFKPASWLGVALLIWLFPSVRSNGKLKLKGSIKWWALIFAGLYLLALILAGLIDGFGKSPYSHSLKGITLNLIMIVPILIGYELVRSYLINSFSNKKAFGLILIALFMTLISITYQQYADLTGYKEAIQFLVEKFGPEFSQNLFATYLAFLGGPLASIIYLGTLKAFHWLSPVLPTLKWITTAFVGTFLPMFFLTTMQSIYAIEAKLAGKDRSKDSSVSWMLTIVVSAGITWFAVGIFPIYPSVIATGSMEPLIKPGDIILVKKLQEKQELKKGEIIQFRRDKILISHRIMDINQEQGTKLYLTKGDNNSETDSRLVRPEEIKGTIIKVIPKLGWPTLLLKSDKDIPLEEIEF